MLQHAARHKAFTAHRACLITFQIHRCRSSSTIDIYTHQAKGLTSARDHCVLMRHCTEQTKNVAARSKAYGIFSSACMPYNLSNSSITVFLHDRKVYSSIEGSDECTRTLCAHEALHRTSKEYCSTQQGIRHFQLSVRAI